MVQTEGSNNGRMYWVITLYDNYCLPHIITLLLNEQVPLSWTPRWAAWCDKWQLSNKI